MKTAIIYYSKHHENTKRLLDAISSAHDVTLIDASQTKEFDLTAYDIIGFASGIYYSKFHKSVLQFAQHNLPRNKSVFFLYTCGTQKDSYTKSIKSIALQKSAVIKGSFGCLGFDTFGPFKLVGGIAKGHPNQEDIRHAAEFFNGIINDF